MRLVIAEDTVLLREGLAGFLEDAGHTVLARVGDAESLLAVVAEHDPELAIVDVRMPPTYEDEGMRAAVEIRQTPPNASAVLVLSQHVETRFAVELVGSDGGFGYLLKDRVLDVGDFLEAVERVSERRLRARPGSREASALAAPGGTTRSPSSRRASGRCSGSMAEGRTQRRHCETALAHGEDGRKARAARSSASSTFLTTETRTAAFSPS